MSEQGQEPTPNTQAVTGQPEQPIQESATTGTEWTQDTAAAEIKKLRAEAAKYRKERETAEKAAKDAAEAQAAEQGKFRELYEQAKAQLSELEPVKTRHDGLVAKTREANEKRIEALPDAVKALVPKYDDPFDLAEWLDASAAILAKPQAPSLDAGAGGGRTSATVSDDIVEEFASRMGIRPEHVDRAALAGMYKR